MPRTQNLSSVDAARILVLEQKKAYGLQESEKEELKQLQEKARQAK